jgi:ribosomal protein L11 methylase PrmA
LASLVEPGGRLILAGILETQAENVLQSAENNGFALEKRKSSLDWVALQLRKTG